ncbi:MAG TPA: phosphotransferase family protein, partial [Mycobacterium sp.]|nr:phosphotransferase family protein [Mycobacterium sp.]
MLIELGKVLQPVLGDTSIENLHALTGGASRTTWAFDAVGDGTRRAL